MNRILAIFAMATLVGYGQKIETEKADRTKITRLATTENHLSVLEFNESVQEVAVGSSSFKVEWRENKVFVQPLEPGAATNLFVWTASGRQSYELVPARSVDEMQFAIDEEPVVIPAKQAPAPVAPPKPTIPPPAMLMDSTPVKLVGSSKNHRKVEIILEDVYKKDGRVYLRYAIANNGPRAYLPATPVISALKSPHTQQSLVGLRNVQLAGDFQIRWKDEAGVPVVHGEMQAPILRPGQTAQGVVAFDMPKSAPSGQRTVLTLRFPEDGINGVSAFLVL